MKKLLLFALITSIALCAFAGQFHTIPLNDSAYRIIRYAELRGIIPIQSDVKPYSLNTVKTLLTEIRNSDKISRSERAEINNLIESLESRYGAKSEESIFKNGSIVFSGPFGNLKIGVKASSDNRVGTDSDEDRIISSRNLVSAFVMGDIKDLISYDVNFSFVIDKLDTAAYNFNDFDFTSDGQYFIGPLNEVYNLNGEEGIGVGLSFSPEITSSFFDDSLRINIGSYRRDWGSGTGNLAISASAHKFEAVEIQYEPVHWFRFSSLVGSLGVTLFEDAYGVNLPTQTNYFDNNLSMHRAEFIFGDFKVGAFESIVWKKRIELSYINPLSIYWIAQNYQGDKDSLIGGLDFSYRFLGIGRLYLSLAIDEFTSDFKHLFSNPRNMIAVQGGLDFAISSLGFGLFTIQGTYIPPFFGSHYNDVPIPTWGLNPGDYSLEYAKGGKGLSYPLNPDSFEILLGCSCSIGRGWLVRITAKDQIQSAQYTQKTSFDKNNEFGTLTNAGLTLNDYMDYASEYAMKAFFSYIWKNTLDLDLTVSKSFDEFPVKLSTGVNVVVDWTRNFSSLGGTNYGDKIILQEWNNPYYRVLIKLGASLYY